MTFDGPLLWMLMGILSIAVGGALWSFAERHGWSMTWWKWLLAVFWYALFCLSFYSAGTLVGEHEGRAGWRVLLLGLFFTAVFGVGLVRLLSHGRRPAGHEGSATDKP
jgi:hypothetical protein